jgi:hypothetical protein
MKAKWLPFIEKSAGLSRPGVGGLACIGDALPRPHVSRKPEKWKITFRNAPVHSPLEHPRTAVTFASVSDPDRTAVELVNRVPRPTDQTEDLAERPKEYRRVRIPFKATCAVTETDSSRMVVAQITQLGRFGCFVQTRKPYRKGTRVHVEIIESGATFVASGVVAYVTGDGMGIVFSMVESESSEVLTTWLSRKPRQFHRPPRFQPAGFVPIRRFAKTFEYRDQFSFRLIFRYERI